MLHKQCLNILLIICSAINITTGSLTPRHRRATADCTTSQWRCNDGSCINRSQLCDGNINCVDQSDETSSSCSTMKCPIFAFRCKYGACVIGTAKCNGIQECADNSDESGCSTANGSSCKQHEMECSNGQCISRSKMCDGSFDCLDKSDETAAKCSSIPCPSFAFKCAYGGCVAGSAKCNGVMECHDGSDEINSICQSSPRPSEPPETGNRQFCSMYDLHANGLQIKNIFDGNQDPTQIRSGITVLVACSNGQTINGKDTMTCQNGKWSPSYPNCNNACPFAAIKSVTTTAKCSLRNAEVSCDNALPGTLAKISCAVGYEPPITANLQDRLQCQYNGEWDYYTFKCIPICGRLTTKIVPFISGGVVTEISEVPWHVAIYKMRTVYDYICGGTIISPKIIVSAAHCFWDPDAKDFDDKTKFKVVAGKTYRDYDAPERLASQILEIDSLIRDVNYQDIEGNYAQDFVLIVVKDYIIFKLHIRPVCVEKNLQSEEKSVPSNWNGRVAGWGYTETGMTSSVLKLIDLKTVGNADCKEHFDSASQAIVTGDKFCAGDTDNNEGVCPGDSGGGFVRSKNINGVDYYYLLGIVSSAISGSEPGKCNAKNLTTFTNINHYDKKIIDTEIRYPIV